MMIEEGYCFDDLLLVPKYSEIKSRADVSLEVDLGKKKFKHPIIPANMSTIISEKMCENFYLSGGLCFVHRFMEPTEQLDIIKNLEKKYGKTVRDHIGVSLGVKKEDYELADYFVKNGVEIICIDIAHGHSLGCMNMVKYISAKYPNVFLVAGNVATGEGALDLWESGADCIKVGVGSSGICSTRIVTSNGVAQMSAIMDVANMKKRWESRLNNKKVSFISDGGCSKPGDVGKSLTMADMVMVGNLVSGCDECPGNIIELEGKKFKRYDGSSTKKQGGKRVEGVKALVPYKSGGVKKILDNLFEGIQSCASYQGVDNLIDLKKNPVFKRVSSSGVRESKLHDISSIVEE
jgi:IMP dehydrogenase/GMP reductase